MAGLEQRLWSLLLGKTLRHGLSGMSALQLHAGRRGRAGTLSFKGMTQKLSGHLDFHPEDQSLVTPSPKEEANQAFVQVALCLPKIEKKQRMDTGAPVSPKHLPEKGCQGTNLPAASTSR